MANENESKKTLKIGTLNVRGCSANEYKREMIGRMFVEQKLDVLALNETKMKGKGECEFGCVKGRKSGVEGRAREGVAMIVSLEVEKCVVEWREVSSRMMWVKARFGQELWVFISVYGPGSERSEEEREDFWSGLDECLQGFEPEVNILLLGDLNARVGNEVVEGVVGRWGIQGVNESGERMIELCVERELAVANTFFKKKVINKYTWRRTAHGRIVEKALMDYVVVSRRALKHVLDVKVMRGVASGMSDHFFVEGKIRVGMSRVKNRNDGAVRKALKVSELKKREKAEEYQERLLREWNLMSGLECVGVEEEWQKFKSAVLECAEKVCGMRRVGNGVRRGGEWWCEEVRMAVKEKRQAFEVWLQRKDGASYEMYKEKRRLARREVRNAKVRADERWGNKLTENFQENKKMFWKEVKRVRKGRDKMEGRVKAEDGTVLTEKQAVEKRWAKYFERLLNKEEGREAIITAVARENPVRVMGELNESPITKKEIEAAVKKLKAGKAAGLDGAEVECIKSGGKSVVEWLVRLLNVCFQEGKVPEDWMSACIVPLYKGKGDKLCCGSYRGISLLSVVGKVYGRVLDGRVRRGTEGEIREEQGGFLSGRGCVDQIFAVRQICEKYMAKGKEVFWAFMDLEKAYDFIERIPLWDILRMYGIGGKLLGGVKSFYENSKACVRVGDGVSEWFPVKVGLRQGCVMSPWLFNLYMDGVVREVNMRVMERGLSLLESENGECKLNQLLFADDTALVADSEEELQHLVREFGRVCKRRKLKVNVNKSKVMRCRRGVDDSRLNVTLEGEQLEEVDCFKYLGSSISVDGKIEGEVKARVNEVAKVQGGLKEILKSKTLKMDAKRRLYEGIAVPTALYGAETWNMSVKDRRRLNVVEMRCLRNMCGVTRRDRIRNEEIRRRTGVMRDLAGRADQSTLRWFGHIERMEEDRLVKRIYRSEARGVAPRGRPQLRWMDGVKRALNDRGVSVDQARVKVRDRNEWRAIVSV